MLLSHSPLNAKRICIYISESDKWHSQPLYAALLKVLKDQGIAGATLLRGMAGFGAHSRMQSTSLEVLSMDLPIIIEAVDRIEKIEAVLELIYPMVTEGLITLEDVQIAKYTHRYLNPLPVDRPVSMCMTQNVISFFHNQTVGEAWKIMLQNNLKAAPIVDVEGQVVGIITDQDLLERAGLQHRLSIAIRLPDDRIHHELMELDKSPIRLADVMSKPVFTVSADDPLLKAVTLMTQQNLKRLPVINKEKELVGIISRLDVLRQVLDLKIQDEVPCIPPAQGKSVGEIMQLKIPMVGLDANLSEIIETMNAHASRRIIVCDDQGRAAGLISETDLFTRIQPQKHAGILKALSKKAKAPEGDETANKLMSPNPLCAKADLSIVEAVRLMLSTSRKWLLVIDEYEQPLGYVDRQALLTALSPDLPPTISI
jgi:CBS-domain-containing membrane protein/PII-like signaling protein